jgi:hypothetical protein
MKYKGQSMKDKDRNILAKAGLLLGLIVASFASGCVVEPAGGYHEGYYDRGHHRWYHEHGWVDCHDGDEHCH